MDNAKQQLTDRLKSANNILVTVSRNPSVDQLASCIGLALFLNKIGKHTAAVFSGQVPSTLEFLSPDETLEQNTDSLRDFIIALDKSKADKLRYKVEDNVVRIFITPYKTSISEADLEFSQGDFNVDVVLALGVGKQEDLDAAITAHGRILHDATVACINIAGGSGLGSINWYDPQASSLCELVTELVQAVSPNGLDNQIATALLTGIVSETDRFSNDKTSSQTMSISAALMSAGANQQLVASKLEEPMSLKPPVLIQSEDHSSDLVDIPRDDDGMIEIDHAHDEEDKAESTPKDKVDEKGELVNESLPPDASSDFINKPVSKPEAEQLNIVDAPVQPLPPPPAPSSTLSPGPKMVTAPPSMGGTLTANSRQEQLDPVTDPMSLPNTEQPQLLEHKNDMPAGYTPPPPTWSTAVSIPPSMASDPLTSKTPPPASAVTQPVQGPSLSDLEDKVKEEEEKVNGVANIDKAREQVNRALNSVADDGMTPEPIQALNAQILGDDLHSSTNQANLPVIPEPPTTDNSTTSDSTTSPPPPVPPPIPFQFGSAPK